MRGSKLKLTGAQNDDIVLFSNLIHGGRRTTGSRYSFFFLVRGEDRCQGIKSN